MIKVRSKRTEQEFVLLGAGYGMFRAQGQSGWGAIPSTREGDRGVVCVSDRNGEIFFVNSEELYVYSVDGKVITEIL